MRNDRVRLRRLLFHDVQNGLLNEECLIDEHARVDSNGLSTDVEPVRINGKVHAALALLFRFFPCHLFVDALK